MKKPIESMNRREMLRLAGATLATAALGCTPTRTDAGSSAMPSCVVRPEQMEGPYFLDAGLLRSDIRIEPTTGEVKEGMPLRLVFNVSRFDGDACAPLEGAVVDVWQCDAMGVYSGFRDMNGYFDTQGQTFLRGHQITNSEGVAEFTTIYPGWYRGRAVHIHFKIRTDPESDRGSEFTSQLYFDDAATAAVFELPPYAENAGDFIRNAEDGLYRRGGSDLMLSLVEEGEAYSGTFHIGLQMA